MDDIPFTCTCSSLRIDTFSSVRLDFLLALLGGFSYSNFK